MNRNKLLKILAPFTILLIVVVFVLNIVSNGSIEHPGKSAYKTKCSSCHGDNGEGIKSLVPPLVHSDLAIAHFDSIPCWITKGMNHPIKVNGTEYDQPMYPLDLNEIQIANVMNFISKEFLKTELETNAREVKARMKNCE